MNSYLDSLFLIRGKTVLLTGGGGHLVGEISKGLGLAGCNVVCCDVNYESAKKISDDIVEKGGRSVAFKLDVRFKDNFQKALDFSCDHYGGVNCVLNGAGLNAPTPFFDISVNEWEDILRVQLTGTMLSCQVFGKYMLDNTGGSIINISSASSGPPLSKAFTYSVAKAGVKNFTQNLAREWGARGVRVNALRPGFFPTKWSMENFITAERNAAILAHTPMGRYGHPSELIGAVIWLFSDASSFVTGSEIEVDGGFTAMTV